MYLVDTVNNPIRKLGTVKPSDVCDSECCQKFKTFRMPLMEPVVESECRTMVSVNGGTAVVNPASPYF